MNRTRVPGLNFCCHEAVENRLISLDLASTKLYCFRAGVHCYYCLYIIFSANPVICSEQLRGGPKNTTLYFFPAGLLFLFKKCVCKKTRICVTSARDRKDAASIGDLFSNEKKTFFEQQTGNLFKVHPTES